MSLDRIESAALAGVPHGFLGRGGGGSQGVVAGLNCGRGSGDDPALVAENRRRAVEAVAPGRRLVGLHQVHGADAVTVIEPWDDEVRPEADALITDQPGVVLGILTADCAPVLLADRAAGVVGAAHAGWKGALAGVTDSTIVAMEGLGARRERLAAAGRRSEALTRYERLRASFEVGEDLTARFTDDDPENARFFTEGPGSPAGSAGKTRKMHFDLEAYIVQRLATAGVRQVAALGLDTYAAPDRFYSYRRATHRGEPTYGRQLSLIAVPQE